MSIPNSINSHEEPVAVSTSDTAQATNASATITYPAQGAGKSNCLGCLYWSFSATPSSAATLSIQDGSGNTVFQIQITSAGAGFVPFAPPKKGSANTQMIITLTAGGSGIVGTVSATQWVEGPGP
jgi:hypothetical protein